MTENTLQEEWSAVCNRIRSESSDGVFVRWLGQITPSCAETGAVSLQVPTRFMQEWLKEKQYDVLIADFWKSENPDVGPISLKLQPHREAVLEKPTETSLSSTVVSETAHVEEAEAFQNTYLDPHFTFENFVVGKPNEFAYAAAKRVAESNNVVFNPLYLHSSVGLGKTHLMHAIAWHIQKTNPTRRVLYLSAEKFMYQFVRALRYDDTVSFRDLFRSVDVLMIDDVQFICGKKATQEEFFHTFNALVDQGKQIILSSDSSPLELKGIEDRLKTRMAQGLVVDIFPTTYEMRIGILQSKAALMGASVPEDVIAFLAERITSNVRELEGALKRVIANADLLGAPINLETTRQVLRDILDIYEKEITIEDIQKAVADFYLLKLSDLKSTRRDRKIARPRQIAMWLSKSMTTKSLPDIGSAFERDHTTIIHAVRTIDELKQKDQQLAADLALLERNLKA